MRRAWGWAATLLAAPLLSWRACAAWDVRRFGGQGAVAPDEPAQGPTGAEPFAHGAVWVVPRADFSATVRVLHAEDYRRDVDGALVPVDLAVAWGALSEAGVAQSLWVHQSSRYYSWRSSADFPIPPGEISRSSANMHMIPADAETEDTLLSIGRGDVVSYTGWLVDVEGAQRNWHSSLTREDTGSYACEVVFVTSVRVLPD